MAKSTVSIVGASGYSGIELFTILSRHSGVRIGKLFANSSAGKHLRDVAPKLSGSADIVLEPYSPDAACTSDVVFLALPSGEAMDIVPELLNRGKRIIDLGGDFRLKNSFEYEQFYRRTHSASNLLGKAVYGLPEWNRENIRSAQLVSNPGCYPTSAVLPLIPLLKEGVIQSTGIAISSYSGVSGAGRSASPELSFAEVNESVKAYKVGVHQHNPEIRSALSQFSGRTVHCTFVPHLLPITRGIYTTIFAQLKRVISIDDITRMFLTTYEHEPFIRVSPERIPEIKHVTNTNLMDIGYRIDSDNNCLIILSVIDNLVKGAAGQAVQNMNLMLGFEETEGLA